MDRRVADRRQAARRTRDRRLGLERRRRQAGLPPATLAAPFPEAHATERWARAVTAVVRCRADPKTLKSWGRAIGVSQSALRTRCAAAHVPAKASLDFARLLRATVRSQGSTWDLHDLLDVVDDRTLRRLLSRAGLSDLDPHGPPLTLHEFLARQRLVTRPAAVRAVLEHLP